jgi:hypothetical protein
MKESKHQRRNRILEQIPTPVQLPADEKEHWPVGPLPDASLNPDKGGESVEEIEEKPAQQKSENGFDEWSVSWP